MNINVLFGAADLKLAKTAKHAGRDIQLKAIGAEIRSRLMKRWAAFEELTKGVKREAKRGYLFAIDGRKLWLRGEHMALNTLLQSMEAIVMKVAMCILYDEVKERRIDARQVTWYHDEFQHQCLEEHVSELQAAMYSCIPAAGDWLESACPLEADVKWGLFSPSGEFVRYTRNWAETH